MKNKLFTILTLSSLFCVILYLIGCFANASFSIKEWSDVGRLFISLIMGIAIVFTICITLSNDEN